MSSTYEVGDTVSLGFTVTVNGAPTNATVALTITQPDGTTLSPAPSNPSTGVYSYDFAPTMNGAHTARWVASGAASAAETQTFTVGGLLSLDEAKAQLDITGTQNDTELQAFIDAVTDVIEGYVGPVVQRSVTEWHDSPHGVILLRHSPVVSVTGVTSYSGTTGTVYTLASSPAGVTTYTYYLDAEVGTISVPMGYGYFGERVQVVYVAGRRAVPPAINLAARLMVQSLWQSQNGGQGLPGLRGETEDRGVFEAEVHETIRSPRIRMLLDPYRQAPVLA